jgi:hypothetical protein
VGGGMTMRALVSADRPVIAGYFTRTIPECMSRFRSRAKTPLTLRPNIPRDLKTRTDGLNQIPKLRICSNSVTRV